jgi:predicted outer membrane lipoprotein
MFSWFVTLQLAVAFGVALSLFLLSVAKRKPSLVSLSLLAVVELGLIVQLVVSIVLVSGGARAKTDTIEFFGYLLVAMMIPAGAAFWALVERNRWSTMVLAISAITVAVMVARMQQIWFGF